MNSWEDRFEIRKKAHLFGLQQGTYYIVDKLDDRYVKNFRFYQKEAHAKAAAVHMFRAEQRKIEKLLLGP